MNNAILKNRHSRRVYNFNIQSFTDNTNTYKIKKIQINMKRLIRALKQVWTCQKLYPRNQDAKDGLH
jgi:hypothetical protein